MSLLMLSYVAVSSLDHFFCDRAIIDKTLFNEICNLIPEKFRFNLELYHNFKRSLDNLNTIKPHFNYYIPK